MRISTMILLAFALFGASMAMAAPPANVAGVWTLTVDQGLETLDIAQGGPGLRTFDGVVAAAANGMPMQVAGRVTVVNTVFAPHGDYPFSGSR